jgi:hypothetical protein
MTWQLYLVLVPTVLFLAVLLWRSGNPPSAAYVMFIAAAAALFFVLVVDLKWYALIPPFQAGEQTYAVVERSVQKAIALGYEAETFCGGDVRLVEEGSEGNQKISYVVIKLAHAPIPDSVLVWEGPMLIRPDWVTVEKNLIRLPGHYYDGPDSPRTFLVRYFRAPGTT